MRRGPVGPVRPRGGRAGRRLSRWLVNGVLVALVVVLGLAALPKLLGYGMLTVLSGSMEPTAPVGSLVVSRPLTPEQVRVDDVVLVREENDGATSPGVLHRIIDRSVRDGAVVVRTQGDANPEPDPTPYVLSGDTMTPVLVVPYAGRAMAFVRSPVGWTAVIALPATVLLWLQLKAIWFPYRRPTPARPAPPDQRERGHAVA